MGVPTFFRWAAERYPLICENRVGPISDKADAFELWKSAENGTSLHGYIEVPEGFDNLYIDVNGIIHNCSHSSGEMRHNVKSEEDIFVAVFQCIIYLVNLVRPKSLLYLAVDGVPPRAKILQQRERRFRSAAAYSQQLIITETIKNLIDPEFKEKYNEYPGDNKSSEEFRFDPIEITPGTPFMERLTESLHFFTLKMINEDDNWRHLKVVVSGSDVPGEGEHKIMEYIRNDKARRTESLITGKDQGSNFRYKSHCVYGLDADLIILSLVTHEPFICLLREQVVFTQMMNSNKIRLMVNMENHVLLHIGILREYIVNDLIQNPELRRDAMVVDRVIDDFVLLTLFVGNDFLPHLMMAKIVDGSFNNLLNVYKNYIIEAMASNPNRDIWLTLNCGDINYDNFVDFLSEWGRRENRHIQDLVTNQKVGEDSDTSGGSKKKRNVITVVDTKACKIEKDLSDFNSKFPEEPHTILEWKNRYYYAKMGISSQISTDSDGIHDVASLVREYLTGLQWVLYYYYRGVPSWSWNLPCKYPPFVRDILLFLNAERMNYIRENAVNTSTVFSVCQVLKCNFDLSSPMTPFEQLMMVLPPQSSYLLPNLFGNLMTEPSSPLYKYYPLEFDVDMDDTNVSWGGVTLLPVIPMKLLVNTMNNLLLDEEYAALLDDDVLHYMESPKLTEEEKERNRSGVSRVYSYKDDVSKLVKSPLLTFNDLIDCHVGCEPFFNPKLKKGEKFPNVLWMPIHTWQSTGRGSGHTSFRYKTPRNLWFPSLSILPYRIVMKFGVDVFNSKSRRPSLFVSVSQQLSNEGLENLMCATRSSYIAVGYPYKHFGKLVSIMTPYVKFIDGKSVMTDLNEYCKISHEIDPLLEKNGILLSTRKDGHYTKIQNVELRNRSHLSLKRLFDNVQGVVISNKLRSVRQSLNMDLDFVCENVIVTYKIVEKSVKDECIRHTYLPLVTFINQSELSVLNSLLGGAGEECDERYNKTLVQVRELSAIKQAVRNHELIHGKYSQPKIQVICTMPGSMYGRIGYLDEIGQTFDNISAVFEVPNYKLLISENAIEDFKEYLKVYEIVKGTSLHEWVSFEKICIVSNISVNVATNIFQSLLVSPFKIDIGMKLIIWDEETQSILCLPGYTKLDDDPQNDHIDPLRMVKYSTNCVKLIRDYQNSFPELFDYLRTFDGNPDNRTIKLNLVYTKLDKPQLKYKLDEITKFCASQPFKRLKRTLGTYQCLYEDEIEYILNTIIPNTNGDSPTHQQEGTSVEDKPKYVRVHHLKNLHVPAYNTTLQSVVYALYLGQMVIYIDHNKLVPVGTKATIIGIYPQNEGYNLYELLLHKSHMSASNLYGRCKNMHGIIVYSHQILPLFPENVLSIETYSEFITGYDRDNSEYIKYV